MTILFVGLAVLEPGNPWWGRFGTLAVGLATRTKCTAGLLILPVVFVVGGLLVTRRQASRFWKTEVGWSHFMP